MRVNDKTVLFLENSSDPDAPWAQEIHHYAFHMDDKDFEEAFARIKSAGIPYGDNYGEPANMKGPGTAPGAQGSGKSVYFMDPSENLLQIITIRNRLVLSVQPQVHDAGYPRLRTPSRIEPIV